jgi:hypothetical protein
MIGTPAEDLGGSEISPGIGFHLRETSNRRGFPRVAFTVMVLGSVLGQGEIRLIKRKP